MPTTKYIIELTEADRKYLTDIVKKGNSPARTIMRANILLASDRGNNKHMTVAEICHFFLRNICKLYLQKLQLLTADW